MRIGSLWAIAGAARPDVSDTMPAAEPVRTVRRLIDMSFPPDVFHDFYALGALVLRRAYRPRPTPVNAPSVSVAGEPLRGLPFQIRRQSPHDLVDDRGRRAADIDDDRPFLGRRLLQGGELVVEQGGRHEMASARRHAPTDQLARARE